VDPAAHRENVVAFAEMIGRSIREGDESVTSGEAGDAAERVIITVGTCLVSIAESLEKIANPPRQAHVGTEVHVHG